MLSANKYFHNYSFDVSGKHTQKTPGQSCQELYQPHSAKHIVQKLQYLGILFTSKLVTSKKMVMHSGESLNEVLLQ